MQRTDPPDPSIRSQTPFLWLCGVIALLSGALLFYSQTDAMVWDEGFHLLAAQLIKAGKTPYRDFFFPQAPFNAYWNAGGMRIFGDSWRTAHALAALLTAAALLLTAHFVFVRFPVPQWRLAAALTAAFIFALNSMIVQFGTVAQAYGMCLFLIVVAFRLSILASLRTGVVWAALVGLVAAAAAGSSLLAAPVGPVLLLWILVYNRTGSRVRKFAAFAAGAAIAFLPLFFLFLKAPRQVMFNLVEFHMFYRGVEWEGATQHNLEVLAAWLDSTQALLLGMLALAGLLFTIKNQNDRRWRDEVYLCGWLSVTLAVYVSTAHPTFQRYYLLTVPFLAILAAVGLYEISSRLDTQSRRFWPVLVVTVLLALGLGKALYERRDSYTWRNLEDVAAKVDQVTPPQVPIVADEHIYFLTRRTPPSGMECQDSLKLSLPPAVAASMHIIPRAELAKRVQARMFPTVQTCAEDDDERFQKLGVPQLYAKTVEIHACRIFWDRLPSAAPSGSRK